MSDTISVPETPKAKALASGIEVWCAHERLIPIEELKPNPRNPNKHPESQLELLAKNIKYFGWRHNILVSKRSGCIVSGHGRLLAAKKLGVALVPVDYQDFANDDEELAVLLADNRLAEISETDEDSLKELLKELDGKIDLDLTGFDEDSLDDLLDRLDTTEGESNTVTPPPVTPKRQKVWSSGCVEKPSRRKRRGGFLFGLIHRGSQNKTATKSAFLAALCSRSYPASLGANSQGGKKEPITASKHPVCLFGKAKCKRSSGGHFLQGTAAILALIK